MARLTSSIHNASDKHIGKYQSKENYHRKKQTKLCEKINLLENSTSDIYAQFCARARGKNLNQKFARIIIIMKIIN